jgi:DNA modification methylase
LKEPIKIVNHWIERILVKSTHKIYFQNANQMNQLSEASIDLVITSPPYPLISMWDEQFSQFNPSIEHSFSTKNYSTIFEAMHSELDVVWNEVFRVSTYFYEICFTWIQSSSQNHMEKTN